ncbi:MAG: diacylglycerol kinase family protein [Gemmatimonadales bacterium]
MATPVHLLLNPAAAGGRAGRRFRRLAPALEAGLGDRLVVHRSPRPGALRELAAGLAREPGTVVAAGGDGTSGEVIGGLATAGRELVARLWWLPLGSGNDLARTLGARDGAADFLVQVDAPATRAIDLGRLIDRGPDGGERIRLFGNSLALGLPPEVLLATERYGKPLGGALSYAVAAVLTLLRHRPIVLGLDHEGAPASEAPYRLIAVSNGGRFGGGMRIAPEARLDDGLLDLVTVGPIPRLEAVTVFPSVYRGRHLSHPAIALRRIERLEISGRGVLPLELDGECDTVSLPCRVEVVPGALRVAHPAGG